MNIKKEKDKKKRYSIARGWKRRLAKLKKTEGISKAAFCEQYGFNKFLMSGYTSETRLAGWDSIDKINDALKKAGV